MGMFDDDPLKAPVVLPDEEPDEAEEVKESEQPQAYGSVRQPEPQETSKEQTDEDQRYALPVKPKQPKTKGGSKRWLIPLVILAMAAGGFGAFKLLKKKPAPAASTAATSSQTATKPAETAIKDLPDSPLDTKYENGFLGVTLSYPSTWIVTAAADKTSVKLESPDFQYKTTDKGQITGNFRIYIRKAARTVDGKYIGRGVAIEPSQKLKYTKPAVGQRTETNLTLFGLDDTSNFAFMMITSNFDLKKGDTLGPNYGKEAETYIIVGGFSAKDRADDLATNTVDPSIVTTSQAYKTALEVLKSLQLQ